MSSAPESRWPVPGHRPVGDPVLTPTITNVGNPPRSGNSAVESDRPHRPEGSDDGGDVGAPHGGKQRIPNGGVDLAANSFGAIASAIASAPFCSAASIDLSLPALPSAVSAVPWCPSTPALQSIAVTPRELQHDVTAIDNRRARRCRSVTHRAARQRHRRRWSSTRAGRPRPHSRNRANRAR